MGKSERPGQYRSKSLSVLLVASLLILTLPPNQASAQSSVTVSIGSASGNVGATVNVPVTIANISGAAGVQFEITYDSARVEPQRDNIVWGQGIGNANIIDGRLSIVIAQATPFSTGGNLLTIPFTLKSVGSSLLTLSDRKVSDTNGNALLSVGVSGAITVTVPKTPLPRVGTPSWTGDVVGWSAVSGAASYAVTLFKNGDRAQTLSSIAATSTVLDLAGNIAQRGPGRYTVTVRAIADPASAHTDGPASAPSAANIKTVTLTRPAALSWSGERLQWSAVAEAINYEIILYRGTAMINRHTVPANQLSYNFKNLFDQLGAGSYTATVQARGDGTVYLHSPVSAVSPAVIRQAAPAPADPPGNGGNNGQGGEAELSDQEKRAIRAAGRPVWRTDPDNGRAGFTVAWPGRGGNVEEFTLTLFRGKNSVAAITREAGDPADIFSEDLSAHVAGAGIYFVRVEALMPGGAVDSLEYSDILVSIAKNADSPGSYLAEGDLSFAGLWMQFTGQRETSGIVALRRFAESELVPPENAVCTGIYLEVLVDEALAGVSALIEVQYDPALLPEGLKQDTLRVYRFNDEQGKWEPLVSNVDQNNRHVWAQVDQFSVLAVFGELEQAQSDLSPGARWSFFRRLQSDYLWLLAAIALPLLSILIFSPRRKHRRRRRSY